MSTYHSYTITGDFLNIKKKSLGWTMDTARETWVTLSSRKQCVTQSIKRSKHTGDI